MSMSMSMSMSMAIRVTRILSPLPHRTYHVLLPRYYDALSNRRIYVAQDLIASPKKCLLQCVLPDLDLRRHRHGAPSPSPTRSFSGSRGSQDDATKSPNEGSEHSRDRQPILLYEGPFATLTLRLKRISLMSAAIGIFGLPALSLLYGTGSVPGTGQIAIIATAGVTAVGSTALLGYCFSPYVHTMQSLSDVENKDEGDENFFFVRIVTRDILARRVETTFDPATDVSPAPNNSRPFCNFMVLGKPMYVHPDLIHDNKLRAQLVGEEPQVERAESINKKKSDDDEFL